MPRINTFERRALQHFLHRHSISSSLHGYPPRDVLLRNRQVLDDSPRWRSPTCGNDRRRVPSTTEHGPRPCPASSAKDSQRGAYSNAPISSRRYTKLARESPSYDSAEVTSRAEAHLQQSLRGHREYQILPRCTKIVVQIRIGRAELSDSVSMEPWNALNHGMR